MSEAARVPKPASRQPLATDRRTPNTNSKVMRIAFLTCSVYPHINVAASGPALTHCSCSRHLSRGTGRLPALRRVKERICGGSAPWVTAILSHNTHVWTLSAGATFAVLFRTQRVNWQAAEQWPIASSLAEKLWCDALLRIAYDTCLLHIACFLAWLAL